MRAIYLKEIPETFFLLESEQAHHLLHVVRINLHDEILILNGRGSSKIFKAVQIKKRSIEFVASAEQIEHSPANRIDLLVSIVKKDALELSLKQACELGLQNVYLAHSEYSQKLKTKEERLEKYLISGIEQANNPYLPSLSEVSLLKFDFAKYNKVIYFSSIKSRQTFDVVDSNEKILLIIGPEGGLSASEEEFITSKNNSYCIKFKTPIQRTPTAIACGIGYILSRTTE